jgi:YhcN/YlaJ family sporulation lipoprotein
LIAYIRILSVICLVIGLVVGCSPQNTAPKQVSPNPQKISYNSQVKKPIPVPQYNKSGYSVSNRLEKIANRMPHVRKSTAISLGKYSVVGLDLDPKLDRGRVGTVKYSVAEALHKDPVGARALVTADVDLVQRLRNVRSDITKGRPISGIMKELAAITERIAPQPTKMVPKRTAK